MLAWRTGLKASTVLAFVVSLLIQVGYPLGVTLYYRRRTHARWQVFAYGAIIYAAFQLFTWLPLRAYIDVLVGSALTSELGAFIWLLASALATSLVEETGRWCGYRYLFPRGSFRLTWRNGVMFGLGHGALETVLLIAGLTFVNLLAYLILSPMDLNALARTMEVAASSGFVDALQEIAHTSWTQPLLVAMERVLTLPHQVAWSLLVMESLAYRQRRWFIFAVLYHASVAVIVPGLARLSGLLVAEGVNVLLALVSLWIILKLRAVSGAEG